MKDQKEINIKYRSKLLTKRDKSGFEHKDYEYDYIKASTACVKRFNTAIMILMGIDGCERNLMEWIGDNMSNGNYITNNGVTRNNFIQFYKKYCKTGAKEYGDKTVSIAFQRLNASGLLISITRGTFMVNPLCYYSGDENSRLSAIKMIMEFKSGIDTKITVTSK